MKDKPTFSQWFESNFSSPKAVLVEYLPEIQDAAASIGASLPSDFISRLQISNHNKNFQYLPTVKGIKDSKQSAYARLGKTILGSETVSVPIIVFTSFKVKNGDATFSPSSYLIRDFLAKRKVFKYNDKKIDQKYSDKILELEIEAEKNAKANDLLKEKASTAVAQLCAAQLRDGFIQTVSNPESYFNVANLPVNNRTEFICARSVRDMLYYQSKGQWLETYSASPRDLIIPMYDIRDGSLQNIQKITIHRHGNKLQSKKRFLPGGRLVNQCNFISEVFNPECFIVTEGYKTGRVIDCSEVGTTVPAFSANNVPNIVRELRRMFPDSLIFTATDFDLDGRIYQNKAKEESNSIPIPAPTLFDGADWADLAEAIGIKLTVEKFKLTVEKLKEIVLIKEAG